MCEPNECMINCKINTAETQTHTKKKERKKAVAYPGIFFGGVQQIQLRTERTGIWGW